MKGRKIVPPVARLVLEPHAAADFRAQVYAHYRANPRPMPWRETRDPYRILVSEVMLQQTQVERVRNKYDKFIARFPHVRSLAEAPLSELLALWQGLGYNRRAIALKQCAVEISGRFGGEFPGNVKELESLPGIGPYTARAVAAFAFDIPTPLIETNIRTVFLHHFFADAAGIDDREIMPLIEAILDHGDPRNWYYALMDYGAALKRSHGNPGRRSAHHVRQTPFRGSNRQLRGGILREVMAEPGITAGHLAGRLKVDGEAVEANLCVMEREGFLIREGEAVYIGEGKS